MSPDEHNEYPWRRRRPGTPKPDVPAPDIPETGTRGAGRPARGRTPASQTPALRGSGWGWRALVLGGFALVAVSVVMLASSLMPGVFSGGGPAAAPADETLRLTVPKMERVKDVPVYTAAANDRESLDAGAIHVEGTGFPWEEEANVYIAGHRLGYPNTGSFLVFYDLDRLRAGDRVVLEDSAGTRYVYEVFDRFVVGPRDGHVTRPEPGRNIVSLQSCTLPDYTRRLIVQGELVDVEESPGEPLQYEDASA